MRDQGHPERAWWFVHRGDGEAHAIHGDGALDGEKPRQGGGELDDDFLARGHFLHGLHYGGGVDVALDQVTVQQ